MTTGFSFWDTETSELRIQFKDNDTAKVAKIDLVARNETEKRVLDFIFATIGETKYGDSIGVCCETKRKIEQDIFVDVAFSRYDCGFKFTFQVKISSVENVNVDAKKMDQYPWFYVA